MTILQEQSAAPGWPVQYLIHKDLVSIYSELWTCMCMHVMSCMLGSKQHFYDTSRASRCVLRGRRQAITLPEAGDQEMQLLVQDLDISFLHAGSGWPSDNSVTACPPFCMVCS